MQGRRDAARDCTKQNCQSPSAELFNVHKDRFAANANARNGWKADVKPFLLL
jgi:hypothetical protein